MKIFKSTEDLLKNTGKPFSPEDIEGFIPCRDIAENETTNKKPCKNRAEG